MSVFTLRQLSGSIIEFSFPIAGVKLLLLLVLTHSICLSVIIIGAYFNSLVQPIIFIDQTPRRMVETWLIPRMIMCILNDDLKFQYTMWSLWGALYRCHWIDTFWVKDLAILVELPSLQATHMDWAHGHQDFSVATVGEPNEAHMATGPMDIHSIWWGEGGLLRQWTLHPLPSWSLTGSSSLQCHPWQALYKWPLNHHHLGLRI